MTNRERFLKKLAEMDNEDLAGVFCMTQRCDDCEEKPCMSGRVAEWLGKEEKDGLLTKNLYFFRY